MIIVTRKAVSPVVALALLLIVAVVAVISFMTWFSSYQSGILTDVQTKGDYGSMTTGIDKLIGDTLYFTNNLGTNVSVIQIKVGLHACTISLTELVPGINEIQLGDCLTDSNIGSSQDVVVITKDKIYVKKVIIKSGSGSLCSDIALLMHFDNSSSNGENNTHIYDFSGYENNGTAQNDAFPISSGKYNGGFYFNKSTGLENEISLGSPPIAEGLDGLTISAWVKTPLGPETSNRGIIYQWGGPDPQRVFNLQIGRSTALGKVRFQVHNGTGSSYVDVNNVYSYANEWHHYVGVFNGTNVMIYEDGVLQNDIKNLTGTTQIGVISNIIIGEGNEGDNFNGTIDELAIWGRALSGSEISSLYSLNSALNCNS